MTKLSGTSGQVFSGLAESLNMRGHIALRQERRSESAGGLVVQRSAAHRLESREAGAQRRGQRDGRESRNAADAPGAPEPRRATRTTRRYDERTEEPRSSETVHREIFRQKGRKQIRRSHRAGRRPEPIEHRRDRWTGDRRRPAGRDAADASAGRRQEGCVRRVTSGLPRRSATFRPWAWRRRRQPSPHLSRLQPPRIRSPRRRTRRLPTRRRRRKAVSHRRSQARTRLRGRRGQCRACRQGVGAGRIARDDQGHRGPAGDPSAAGAVQRSATGRQRRRRRAEGISGTDGVRGSRSRRRRRPMRRISRSRS